MKYRVLSSKGQMNLFKEASIIKTFKLIEYDVKIVLSQQHPEGYPIHRFEFEFCKGEEAQIKAEFHTGDEGYEMYGYSNQFEEDDNI